MRAKLLENFNSEKDLVQFIRKNCKPYLQQNPTLLPMYRGIRGYRKIER